MRAKYKVLGLREADAALAELTRTTAKAVSRRVLMRAARIIADRASELAPELSGRLKSSINATTQKPKGHDSKRAWAEARGAGKSVAEARAAQRAFNRENPGSFAEAFVGSGKDFYAYQQEFGTAHHPPQPFMRPAFEEKAPEALGVIAQDLKNEAQKTAARARQRALRKAPKG